MSGETNNRRQAIAIAIADGLLIMKASLSSLNCMDKLPYSGDYPGQPQDSETNCELTMQAAAKLELGRVYQALESVFPAADGAVPFEKYHLAESNQVCEITKD